MAVSQRLREWVQYSRDTPNKEERFCVSVRNKKYMWRWESGSVECMR